MAVMEWGFAVLLCGMVFARHCECSSELAQPKKVKVELSVLSWSQPEDPTDVIYVVQFNTTLNDWHIVSRGPSERFNFSVTAEDYYGKVFRVRAEKGNQTSVWALSKRVQCSHLHTCAPVVELKVEPDKVHLRLIHRDQSLKDEKGGHLMFRLCYWKRNHTDESKEEFPKSNHFVLEDLDAGQEYCFQVNYLHLHKPFGMPSSEICRVIPESSKQRTLRIVLLGILFLVGLFVLGSGLYYTYMHHKRIKECLQPPLDIPDHFEEFFFSEFSQPDESPRSESYEVVHFVEELSENQDTEQDVQNSRPA
ncbi:interferon gamma receptor 2 [Silurus meridionalis]|uniref:Uncharacterized protein n=1 Tax=Silurus meridionalis TaxID=175797 RepID=A0A8T0BS61_SILME|nr:interferon gamma receptor 2 [Silurus meridionalis]KAF7709858.1 hypothetical protein HF521_016708 [Silurus meridionalis]